MTVRVYDPVKLMTGLLPGTDGLTDWQTIQRDVMLKLMQYQEANNATYSWTAGHDGCFHDHVYRGQKFLRGYKGKPPKTYCCGIALEHWFLSWTEFLDDLFNTDENVDPSFIWQLRAHFYVYRDPPQNRYDRGAGSGIEALGKHMDERAGGKNKFAEFKYHTDPYAARFGDYVQIQNKEDIHADGGGHSAIFVSLDEQEVDGEKQDCIRVFNSNSSNDYGFRPGVGMGWYVIGKENKETGFERVFHFGSIID